LKAFIIYKEDYPWDVRVEKLAISLKKYGYEVVIICRNLENKEEHEISDLYEIQRLPRMPILPKIASAVLNAPFWFNPIWLSVIYKNIKRNPGSLVIVRDLPLLKSAIILSKLFKTKTVYDMAEVYPEMYASAADHTDRSLKDKIIKSPYLAGRYESAMLKKVNHTLVMIEESRDRLLRKGIPEDKISIVSNTPEITKFGNRAKPHTGSTLYLVYVGFLTPLRGLDLLIRATKEFVDSNNNNRSIYIDIVGKGCSKTELKKLVDDLGLQDNIKIHGWLEQSEVESLMARANVGALTYRVCGHWNHTIPNKIFDYMLAGLPVLTTPVIPISRIIKSTDCGIVAADATPSELAIALNMLTSASLRNQLGLNGINAIHSKYNWREDEQRLHTACDRVHSATLLTKHAPESSSGN